MKSFLFSVLIALFSLGCAPLNKESKEDIDLGTGFWVEAWVYDAVQEYETHRNKTRLCKSFRFKTDDGSRREYWDMGKVYEISDGNQLKECTWPVRYDVVEGLRNLRCKKLGVVREDGAIIFDDPTFSRGLLEVISENNIVIEGEWRDGKYVTYNLERVLVDQLNALSKLFTDCRMGR